MNNSILEVVEDIKELGVFYDWLLLFDKNVSEKLEKSLHDVGYNYYYYNHFMALDFVWDYPDEPVPER